MVAAIVAGVIVVALMVALVVAVVVDRGPSPADVAFAYEQAWDHLDFASLWTLSGHELHDGLARDDFVAAKTAAYAGHAGLGHLHRHVEVEQVDDLGEQAVVRTRVELLDGEVAHNRVHLADRAGAWVVVDYRLAEGADTPPT